LALLSHMTELGEKREGARAKAGKRKKKACRVGTVTERLGCKPTHKGSIGKLRDKDKKRI